MDPFHRPACAPQRGCSGQFEGLLKQAVYELRHSEPFAPPCPRLAKILARPGTPTNVTVIGAGGGGGGSAPVTTGKHDGLIVGGAIGFIN